MGSAMSGWKLLSNLLLPPPLVLTLLLALPLPRAARRQLLELTSRVLSFTVLGGVKLIHFALLVSGLPLLDSGARTLRIGRELHGAGGAAGGDGSAAASDAARLAMSANVRTRLLASKWREERNFWISALCFVSWALLTVAFGLVRQLIALEDAREALWDEVDDLRQVPRRTAAKKGSGGASAAAGLAAGRARAGDAGAAVGAAVGRAREAVSGAVTGAVGRARGAAGAGGDDDGEATTTALPSPATATRRRAGAA